MIIQSNCVAASPPVMYAGTLNVIAVFVLFCCCLFVLVFFFNVSLLFLFHLIIFCFPFCRDNNMISVSTVEFRDYAAVYNTSELKLKSYLL